MNDSFHGNDNSLKKNPGSQPLQYDPDGNTTDHRMPSQGNIMQIELDDAISYNSLVELKNVFNKQGSDHERFGRG